MEPLELAIGNHFKTIAFIVGMEWRLVLGLSWLKKWNPWVDWTKGTLMFPSHENTPKERCCKEKAKCRKKVVAASQSGPLQGIPWEYCDLFSEVGSYELPPHWPTDYAIENLLEAKLPKLKLCSMTPRELDYRHNFIDKNLVRLNPTCQTQSSCPSTVLGEERWFALLMRGL